MHLHASALDAFHTFLQVIVLAFFWRIIATRYADTPVGRGMAFIL